VFGGQLDWQRLEGSRACRIKKVLDLEAPPIGE
jgi:hypothetical protein